jgi:hypothetical protein
MTSTARVLLGFAVLGTSFLSGSFQHVGAQSPGEAATASEPNLQEPALQLKLTPAGVDVVPSPARTVDGYTLEEMETRVRLAKVGVGVSAVPIFVGAVLAVSTITSPLEPRTPEEQTSDRRTLYAGAALAAGGAAAMIATGGLLAHRKRKRNRLQEAYHGRPHRVQWDLKTSRLVF